MPAPGAHIQVIGLKEFRSSVRRADARLPRELKRGFDTIGRAILVPEIKSRIEEQLVDPNGEGNLVASVRSQSATRFGKVTQGVTAVPYAGWWEFGGSTKSPRGDTTRRWVDDGRSVYPALAAKRTEIIAALEILLGRLRETIEAR